MIVWLDAQLSPTIASWIRSTFSVEVHAVRDLGLRDATDPVIFQAAKHAGAVVATKDSDFAELVERLGSPPQVIWITCGNTSNARLKEILMAGFPAAKSLLEKGEPLVEIADSP
jgi:predicted nuclease of predicted toxin-antitoxin system